MFAQRLKDLRQGEKISQAELASALNISNRTISMYEQGNSEPNVEILSKIADYFNVTADYLIGRTSCKNIENQSISDSLGIDEKTIEILLLLSATTYKYSNLDYLEAIIQHPQFPALLNQINSYIVTDTQGWHDIPVSDSSGNIINTISGEVMKASSMQLIQTTFKGIVESIPYSKHFLNKN